ncbi:transcriptional regulator [Salmonella enterica]|nr:transcriptional regulator [Salmonella enterica]
MKIAIVNNSGNVGKSTLCQYMFVPNMPNAEVIRVESINNDGDSEGEKLKAHAFVRIFDKIMGGDEILVDVGSSNIEVFMEKMTHEFEGSHMFIDYFLIPLTPDEKQQIDTINMIVSLIDLGVDSDKIKIIFNKTDKKKTLEEQFSILFNDEQLHDLDFTIDKNQPSVSLTEIFKTIAAAGYNYKDISILSMDKLKENLKTESDKEEKKKIQLLMFYKMGVDSFNKNLSIVYKYLNLN